jgi:hypothetical protein
LKVPRNKNYLAMTGQTIHYFPRNNSSGLSKELKWHMNEILIQGHHEGVAIHTQQLKAIAGLSKIMDRIGGTNQDRTPSNVELMKANSPQSFLPCLYQRTREEVFQGTNGNSDSAGIFHITGRNGC